MIEPKQILLDAYPEVMQPNTAGPKWLRMFLLSTYDLTKEQVALIKERYSYDNEVLAALYLNGHCSDTRESVLQAADMFRHTALHNKLDAVAANEDGRPAVDVFVLYVAGMMCRRDLKEHHIRQFFTLLYEEQYPNYYTAVLKLLYYHPSCTDALRLELTLKYGGYE